MKKWDKTWFFLFLFKSFPFFSRQAFHHQSCHQMSYLVYYVMKNTYLKNSLQ